MSKEMNVVRSGDCIGFLVDNFGFLTTPSSSEPLPEREEVVTHLRASNFQTENALTSDFYRNMFRIENDLPQKSAILYGSIVRLVHMPTDFYLVASNDVDRDYVPPPGRDSSYQPAAVYLKNTVGIKELNASKWIIMSRYKLREDGDIVRINDFIVLKSVQYKTKCLSSFEINTSSPKSYDQLVGLADESIAFSKQGFQLLMLRAAEIEKDDKEDSNGEKGNGDIDKKNSDGNKGLSGADGDTRTIVYTGDYIRISHKEKAGHFITRVDDEDIMSTGVISLLGSICKKQEMSKSEAQAVYVRSFDAQKPLRPCDFPTPATCTGIWQIMPVDLYSDYSLHGPAIYGLKIRLRHTLSGQYLCIRQLTSSDTPALQSSYQELDANMQAVSQTNRLESNFDLKFTTPKKLTKKWVVATSDEPDNQTIFTICQLDVTSESDNIVNYNEIIYFKHNATKLRLQVSNNSEDGDQSVWWEYDGDSVITVDSSNLDTVLASNVCILEKVAIEEVQDVLFVNKLLPLARATTTMMQLSPRSKDLCIPMFRHFFKLLQTTVLWLLGHSDGDGSLAGQASLVESGNTNQAPALSRILYKWAMQDENDDETESAKPQSLFSLSYGESKDEGDVKLDRTKEQFDEISTVDTPIHEERFVSAMAPWLGRGICTDSDDGCAKRLEDVEVVDASNSTAKLKLKHFVDHNLPSNTLIMRRQTILAESRFLEILLKFLNVVLLLDKRYSDAIGVEIKDKSFPSIVTNCCLQIHDVLNATVIRNEKIAFKLMSLHGTLYSMINQILIGWMPPLTTILELTCSDDTGMAMEKQGKSEASNIIKNMTSIMINAISAGDLRRVVTQLIKLKNIADSRAQNILQLLTILCSSGMSNKYFQDILVNCISSLATVTESDLAMEQRRTCAQEDCILFYSRLGDNNQWEISFATTGLMPPVEELNQNVIEEKARREANNLKLLFESYNDSETEDDLLDIGECFNFMEDLGFGSYRLYEELQFLQGSNFWQMICWWCSRCCHFFPSSSAAQNQLSAPTAMKFLGMNVPQENNQKAADSSADFAAQLKNIHIEVLNSRYDLLFFFPEENDVDGALNTERNALYLGTEDNRSTVEPASERNFERANTSFYVDHDERSVAEIDKYETWINIAYAFDGSKDKDWFRSSIKLLTELCKGRNVRAQKLLSYVLPCECVLFCLNDSLISKYDKGILCELLRNAYVDHDLVFSTRFIPSPVTRLEIHSPQMEQLDRHICCYNESPYLSKISIGSVFSRFSRVIFPGSIDGVALRWQLYKFVCTEIESVQFNSNHKATMSFASALLQLVFELICVGFFNEPEFEFFETKKIHFRKSEQYQPLTNLHNLEAVIASRLLAAKERDGTDDAIVSFNYLLAQNSGDDIDSDREDDRISESSSRYQFSTTSKKKSKSETSNGVGQYMKGTLVPAPKKKGKKFRQNLDQLSNIFDHFNEKMTSTRYVDVITKAITLLNKLEHMRNMLQIQTLWNSLSNVIGVSANKIKDNSYFQNLDRNLSEHVVEQIFSTKSDLNVANAVLSGIIHHNKVLTKACIDLIDYQLSMSANALATLPKVCFVDDADVVLQRYAKSFFLNVMKYYKEVFSSPMPTLHNVLLRIQFTLGSLRKLCFDSLSNKISGRDSQLDPHDKKLFKKSFVGFAVSTKATDFTVGRRAASDVPQRSYLTDYTIPCTPGSDSEYYFLDLENLMQDSSKKENLIDYFGSQRQAISEAYHRECQLNVESLLTVVFDDFVHCLVKQCRRPVERVRSATRKSQNDSLAVGNTEDAEETAHNRAAEVGIEIVDPFRSWQELYVSERHVVDSICTFLAEFLHTYNQLADKWLLQIKDLLLQYYPYSVGIVSLADAIIRYCNSDTLVYEKAFLESLLFNRIGSWLNNGDCTAIVPYRLLTYLLHKHGKIVATTSKFITSNLRKIMKSSFFTGKVFESQNDVSYYYLEFISALFRLQKVPVAISKEINRFAENRELILTILSNRETPLALKISLLPVVRSFQSRSSQQLEYVTAIVLEDIKRIRMFLAITSGSCEAPDISEKFRRINTMKNDDDGNLAASTYCYQYLVRGAMKHCKVCIKSTFIENETLINDHIILEARSCCSASYNNQTTDEVVSSLRKTFPTSTNSIHVDKGTIASSVIDCMLMILNILKMNDMKMLEAFSSADMDSLLWLLSACDIACREGCVTNTYVQVSVEHKNEDFNRDALKTFVSENAESNLNFVDFDNFTVVRVIMEKNFQGFMRDRVLKLARSSLLEKSTKVLLDKSIEFIEKAPELLKDKNDEHNLLLPDEFALYNSEFLRSTSVFKILEKTMKSALKFLEFGGKLILEDISSPAIKSESFASKFSTFTNYQLWLLGGGKLFKNIFEYLKFLKSPTQGDYNLLQIVIQLLHNTIDEIRASVLLPKKVKLKSVNKQIENIRKIQNALVSFGAVDFIIRTMESPRNDDYSWVFTRFALELSSELVAHRNANLQNLLVTKMLDDIRSKSSNFPNVAKGLKSLIRLCLTEVSSEKFSMSPTYGDQNQLAIPSTAGGGESVETETDSITARDKNKIKVSLLIKAIFEFMGSLCEGSNQRSKEFFSGLLDRKSVHNINEVSILTDTALDVFTRQLHYIDSEVFYDKLAPYIWLDKNSDKRRFISWTNPYSNIFEYTRWLLLSITMFENLSKVCISGLHLPLIRAIDKVPLVLEYLGLLNMSIEASVDEALGAGLSITRGITWEGGDPFKFAGKYAKELASLQLLEQEKDYTYIESCLFHWNTVLQESKRKDKASNENTKSTALSTIDKAIVVKNSKRMGSAYSSTYFVRLFGIQKKKMLEIARHCEHKALEAVLAVIDACEVSETAEVCSKFNDAILLQNMKSTFDEIISWSSGLANVDKQTGINVYYISLINTMGTSYSETTKELLGNWEDTMTKNGYNPKLLYGTVELLDDNQRVVRHFYPIPSFVKRYWLYPETQLTKEKVVVEVNRNSPEEKIADFLDQMERLVRVMKRQERLRLLLTPPIHAIFGGKTLPLSWLFPRIRISLLVLTFIIVIYITYDQSLPSDFDASGGNYLKYYYDWYFRDNFERIVKSGHFIITCTVAIRSLLNCEASDEIPSLIETDSNIINMLGKVVTIPYWLFLMINECLWSIILVGLSYLGLFVSIWFYVPCLLDIVFLFKDMYFLYVAIVRNLSKIVFTLLLAFLCLYFFAVMAFLFFPDQYEFDGHSDCNSLTACFKLHLDYGLINAPDWEGGYISPAINGLNGAFVYGTVIARLLGTVYNLSFIILINLVLQAIISGLIIDTFSEMRAENETIQQDIKDKCFICSIGTEVFEQNGISVHEHQKEEHNMWHYVWFKLYLEFKDPLTYSYTEYLAANAIDNAGEFVSIMPIKRSLSIEKKRGQMSGDESVETKLDSLAKLVKDFTLADKDTPDAAISRIFGKPRKADGTDAGSSVDGDTVNGSDDDTPPYTGRNYQ